MEPRPFDLECESFTRHLVGVAPNPYVLGRYEAAHAARPDAFTAARGFGAFTVSLGRLGPFPARMADAYCRLFEPRGVLRRKLVLLLAILETTPPFHREFDAVRGSRTAQAASLAAGLAAWALALGLGTLVLLPARLVLGADRSR